MAKREVTIRGSEPLPAAEALVVDEWVEKIGAGWRKTLEAVMETGKILSEARAGLNQHQWGVLLKKLPFSTQEAWRLMKISKSRVIAGFLPEQLPSYSILTELSDLPDERFIAGVRAGIIGPDTKSGEARAFRAAVLNTDEPDKPIRQGKTPRSLPSPAAAIKIAAETGRIIAASDGRLYTGAGSAETEDHVKRRTNTFAVLDAIKVLSRQGKPAQWLKEAEKWWLTELEFYDIDAAETWLGVLRAALERQEKVIEERANAQ